MPPFSQERAQWIEGRLFCLARMARDLSANGMKRATTFIPGDYQEAFIINKGALEEVQRERMVLMAERAVIEEYNKGE